MFECNFGDSCTSSVSSEDDFYSAISSETSSESESTFLAATSESPCKFNSDMLVTRSLSGDGPISCITRPTSDDIESSQIFLRDDSSNKWDGVKRFNECVQFFTALSTQNKANKTCKIIHNIRLREHNEGRCKSSEKQSVNKCTWTLEPTKKEVHVQTNSPRNRGLILTKNTSVQDSCEKLPNNSTSKNASCLNVVTASATSVASLLNDKSNSKATNTSTAKSTESGLAAIQASTEAISSSIKALEKQYENLTDEGEIIIKLSTICIINKAFASKSNNSTENNKSFQYFPIVNKSYIANISDSSTNSSATDNSLPEKSKVFVATPFTITTVMAEDSHSFSSVLQSSVNQFNGSNNGFISPEPKQNTYEMVERNIEYTKILQNSFFRTSTPLLGVAFKRKCISNMNLSPSSSFVKSTSFKELKTNPTFQTSFSKSLDYRQNGSNSNVGKLSEKRAFLSLYNLTCPQVSGIKSADSVLHNPTNIFFTNSQSYASLKETDIDSGKEILSPIYKETNLDKYSHNDRGVHFKAKSLSSICKGKKSKSLVVCGDIDENILNNSPNSSSLSVSTNLFYVRLRGNAKSPAQIKVAKSITKLNIPEWMNSVEFSDKKLTNIKHKPQQIAKEIHSPIYNNTLQNRIKKYKLSTSQNKHPEKADLPCFSLPSSKFHTSESKLEPIKVSKARQALDLYKNPIVNTLTSYDISAGMVVLAKEFLSHVYYLEEDFKGFVTSFSKRAQECSRASCFKKLKTITVCEQCFDIYCSSKCMIEDKKLHLKKCTIGNIKKKLIFLLESLSKTQIMILSQMSELGLQHFGKGFILWNVENNSDKTLQFRLPKYVLTTQTKVPEIIIKLKEVKEQDFLFVIISKDIISDSCIVSSNCYKRQFAEETLLDLSPLNSYKRSALNSESRQELVDKIVSLLHSFNMDLRERNPATFLKLMEYASTGCWFVQQVIKVSDPNSGSLLKLIIEPDHLPQKIKI